MKKNKMERPCIKLEYCPYGWLVELFPLDGQSTTWNGKSLDIEPKEESGTGFACEVFGHDCPIFYLFSDW